jgi:hypothetical protein
MSLAVLDELRAIGVEVVPSGDNLVIRPASKVPQELKERLRAAKAEVLAVLARPTVEAADCKHCGAAGECSCPCCTLRRTDKAVPCLMCRPQERQAWLAATRSQECWHCGGSGKCACIGCARSGVCALCTGSGKAVSWVQ